MDLIADLDTQLLNTFVFVLQKLKGLLPLIFNEDVLYSGNEVKIGNVDGVTKIVLLIDVTQSLYITPFDESNLMPQIRDAPSMEHASLASLHQSDGLGHVSQSLSEFFIGAFGKLEADFPIFIVSDGVTVVFREVDTDYFGDFASG